MAIEMALQLEKTNCAVAEGLFYYSEAKPTLSKVYHAFYGSTVYE